MLSYSKSETVSFRGSNWGCSLKGCKYCKIFASFGAYLQHFFNFCHTWWQNFAFLALKSNNKGSEINRLVFLAGLKQFQCRKLWNRTSFLGIWRSVFSRREWSGFSSWMQFCLHFWRIVQTHRNILQRKLMQILGTLPEIWQIFIVSIWRWVGEKSALGVQRLA